MSLPPSSFPSTAQMENRAPYARETTLDGSTSYVQSVEWPSEAVISPLAVSLHSPLPNTSSTFYSFFLTFAAASDKKYHVEHFTCSLCSTLFGPQDSYYEHDGDVYCHFHYSTRFATKCAGCSSAILKQFVEINRNMRDECWHPECYMINKVHFLITHPIIGSPSTIHYVVLECQSINSKTHKLRYSTQLGRWRPATAPDSTTSPAACIHGRGTKRVPSKSQGEAG